MPCLARTELRAYMWSSRVQGCLSRQHCTDRPMKTFSLTLGRSRIMSLTQLELWYRLVLLELLTNMASLLQGRSSLTSARRCRHLVGFSKRFSKCCDSNQQLLTIMHNAGSRYLGLG